MYLTVVGAALLLLLAWHYSIQAAAHQSALSQVRTWLQNMGATAEQVQFRMLRNTLTINNIKATIQQSPLHIQQLLIKGNPATITTDNPQLQYVIIQQASFHARQLSQTWKELQLNLPTSISSIFQHSKNISIEKSRIQHLVDLPDIFIQNLSLSGAHKTRQISGDGHIGTTQNPWHVQSKVPHHLNMQSGRLTSNYQGIQTIADWSGSWFNQNMELNVQQTQLDTQASLTLDFKQKQQQWLGHISAQAWPMDWHGMKSKLTGQSLFTGTPQRWQLNSTQLQWDETSYASKGMFIKQMLSNNLHIDSSRQLINLSTLDIKQASVRIDTQDKFPEKYLWNMNIGKVNIDDLEAELLLNQQPLTLPPLTGTATVKKSMVKLNLSSQQGKQHWQLQGNVDDIISIKASHVPLLQLRNLLPNPLQKNSLTIEGTASLRLKVSPHQQWLTSGKINVSDMHLASKNQIFKAEKLSLNIQNADINGVHLSSVVANMWGVQLPLTPRQAWDNSSQWDEWASIPWSIQNITLSDGFIALGHQDKHWLSHTNLKISHWQSSKTATLQANTIFGLAPLQINMTLQPDANQLMQWQTLNIKAKHANLFALSDWLTLSGLPTIERGHASFNIEAEHNDSHINGHAQIQLARITLSPQPSETDVILQYTDLPAQQLIHQLNQTENIHLNFPFQGIKSWTEPFAINLLQQTQLAKTNARNSKIFLQRKLLGSFRIHQNKRLSQNERVRLRTMIQDATMIDGGVIEIVPELGTAALTPDYQTQILNTQKMTHDYMSQRNLKPEDIYIITAQNKHRSMRGAGAVHIFLVY